MHKRMKRSPAVYAAFRHHRKTWSPEAAYGLTAIRYHQDPVTRLAWFFALVGWGIPIEGIS